MTIRLLLRGSWPLLAATVGAQAQTYPDKTIRIISGTQTGTSGDLAGRLLAQKLTAQIGQPVVFESRPGANGQIAANYVKTLPPDGYNILYVASSTIDHRPADEQERRLRHVQGFHADQHRGRRAALSGGELRARRRHAPRG